MDTSRFTFPDPEATGDRERSRLARKAIRRFGRKLSLWLERHAGPDGVVAHHHANGELTLEVELPGQPGRRPPRPFRARITVTDYDAD